MKPFKRPKSLTELVTEALRDRIVAGDFDLGSQLSEARIAALLQVSRTPVREAFNRLEIEGLLHVAPQRGTFVFNLEPDELAKLCDARVSLETAALAAAIRDNPGQLHARLDACVTRMARARRVGDVSAYLVLVALVFVTINLVVDLLYYAVDPRLKVDRGTSAGRIS